MRRFVPCTDANVPELWDNEEINLKLEDVELCVNSEKGPIGRGTLYVTTKRVLWLGVSEETFDFDVPYIVLHAISRDENSYPKPCVYCQLEYECEGDADQRDEDTENDVIDELFIVPSKDEEVRVIFDALSHAALLNPDPPEEGEQEGDDELIYNTDEVNLGAEQARALAHLESVFTVGNAGNTDCMESTMAELPPHHEGEDDMENSG